MTVTSKGTNVYSPNCMPLKVWRYVQCSTIFSSVIHHWTVYCSKHVPLLPLSLLASVQSSAHCIEAGSSPSPTTLIVWQLSTTSLPVVACDSRADPRGPRQEARGPTSIVFFGLSYLRPSDYPAVRHHMTCTVSRDFRFQLLIRLISWAARRRSKRVKNSKTAAVGEWKYCRCVSDETGLAFN
jgi:hypothetical protein